MLLRSSSLSPKSYATDSIISGNNGTNDSDHPIPSKNRPNQVKGTDGSTKKRMLEGPRKTNPNQNIINPNISHALLCMRFKINPSTKMLENEYTNGCIQKY